MGNSAAKLPAERWQALVMDLFLQLKNKQGGCMTKTTYSEPPRKKLDEEMKQDDGLREKFVACLKNHKSSVDQLSERFNMTRKCVTEYIKFLRVDEGIKVESKEDKVGGGNLLYYINLLPTARNTYRISGPDEEERTMSFGFVSDLHFGSKFHLAESFHNVMDKLNDLGVTKVYIAGDVVDGYKVYRGQEITLKEWDVKGQSNLAAKAFAQHPTIEFEGIAGNHDYSFTKQNGVSALELIALQTNNFTNRGDIRADIIYHGIQIRLLHGGQGRVYATSYPSQTYLRDYLRGLSRRQIQNELPHILLLGHYHTMHQGREFGIQVMQPGSFQDGDNEYCLRHGLTGPNGAFHVELSYKNAEITRYRTTYIEPDPDILDKEKGAALAGLDIDDAESVAARERGEGETSEGVAQLVSELKKALTSKNKSAVPSILDRLGKIGFSGVDD
jgi:predicted phosphodiesterase/biotin operon repressor